MSLADELLADLEGDDDAEFVEEALKDDEAAEITPRVADIPMEIGTLRYVWCFCFFFNKIFRIQLKVLLYIIYYLLLIPSLCGILPSYPFFLWYHVV